MASAFTKTVLFLLSFVVISVFAGLIVREDEYAYNYISWPDLEGELSEDASTEILRQHPRLKIIVRLAKNGITSEIRPNIVYFYEDEEGLVKNIPETVERIRMLWPKLEGLSVEEAEKIILMEKPDAEIELVQEGSNVEEGERNLNRVRLFIDSELVVVGVPKTG